MSLLKYSLLLPCMLLIVGFAVANRHIVAVFLDPVGLGWPGFGLALPLYTIVFICFSLGIVAGAAIMYINQHKWRARARGQNRENRALRLERDRAEQARHL